MVKFELFTSCVFTRANLYTLILFFAFNVVMFSLLGVVVSEWGTKEWEASLLFFAAAIVYRRPVELLRQPFPKPSGCSGR